MSDSRHGRAREVIGADVQARPRLSPEPVRALIGRVERSATRATVLAEALSGDGQEPPAALMRDVAAALGDQLAMLREVLAYLTSPPPDPPGGVNA